MCIPFIKTLCGLVQNTYCMIRVAYIALLGRRGYPMSNRGTTTRVTFDYPPGKPTSTQLLEYILAYKYIHVH